MDERKLIRAMTAGDLVESAVVVAQQERGMGAEVEMRLLEVTGIDYDGDFLQVSFRDKGNGDRIAMSLRRNSPLLVTGIRI